MDLRQNLTEKKIDKSLTKLQEKKYKKDGQSFPGNRNREINSTNKGETLSDSTRENLKQFLLGLKRFLDCIMSSLGFHNSPAPARLFLSSAFTNSAYYTIHSLINSHRPLMLRTDPNQVPQDLNFEPQRERALLGLLNSRRDDEDAYTHM